MAPLKGTVIFPGLFWASMLVSGRVDVSQYGYT